MLGEQSAKSLRGIKMEDVIFAGTRDRKRRHGGGVAHPGRSRGVRRSDQPRASEPRRSSSTRIAPDSDWDEDSPPPAARRRDRRGRAEAQPGTSSKAKSEAPADRAEAAPKRTQNGGVAVAAPNAVVLKIRRRKFERTPARAGEITITRRLFRSGDSEYLLNGKLCRLRDIQDIFMGTGLGGESYAIIGQERIGQLLSSKPHDRRAIIEEAAGITRFKTKKRLAELRLESAKQNLARVNDIFEEVTRQMNSLKRQAAKAERYGALRDELRTRLRVVLASRMAQLDAEQTAPREKIAALATQIDAHSRDSRDAWTPSTQQAFARGYELDQQIAKEAQRTRQPVRRRAGAHHAPASAPTPTASPS